VGGRPSGKNSIYSRSFIKVHGDDPSVNVLSVGQRDERGGHGRGSRSRKINQVFGGEKRPPPVEKKRVRIGGGLGHSV